MKRIILSFLLAGTAYGLFAQSVDKAKDLLKSNKLPEAKAEIDKVLAVEKNQKNAEAWYLKLKIYDAIAAKPDLASTVPDAYDQAFDALQKYVQFDDKKMVSLTLDQYKPVNEIYQGYFQNGATDYNAQKYPEALGNFRGAIKAIGFMYGKGWVKQSMDTTSVLYAGISAEKSNQRDTAANYYRQIADSGITKIGGNDMVEIYKWLADYYSKKGDNQDANKYLAIGEQKYPNDPFWSEMQLDNLRKAGNKDSLFAKYEQITKAHPDSSVYFFNYGVELYTYATDTSSGKRPANADQLIAKAKENVGQSLKLNADFPQSSMLMGQILYNEGVELQQQAKLIKGTKPDDVKKKADIRAQAGKRFDEAIPYFQKVDELLGSKGKLKMDDRHCLKDSYDLLVTIYDQKHVQDKVNLYTDKFNNVDKVH